MCPQIQITSLLKYMLNLCYDEDSLFCSNVLNVTFYEMKMLGILLVMYFDAVCCVIGLNCTNLILYIQWHP